MKKKSVRKNKRKLSLKKIFKGFTLVELLAVIVILAIIMIIAIPNVLSSMKAAKQEGFIEYANKIMNKTEEVYLNNQLMGVSYSKPSDVVYIAFDISKDLGLTSTGNYNGFGFIRLHEDNIDKGVYLFDDEYLITYSTTDTSDPINKSQLQSVSQINQMIKASNRNYKLQDFDFYDINAYIMGHRRCTKFEDSTINGSTGLQVGCKNGPNDQYYPNGGWECNSDAQKYDNNLIITAMDILSSDNPENIYSCNSI